MDVEVVSIGDELLLGFTIDTNAPHFAREGAAHGIQVVRRATVGDGPEAIAAAVREALDRTGAVITSGGLITMESRIARVLSMRCRQTRWSPSQM